MRRIKCGGDDVLVDDCDYLLLSGYKWVMNCIKRKSGFVRRYAVTWIRGKNISMHRLIMGANSRFLIDHKNGNGLDNRRSNLRFCTYQQNLANARKVRKLTSTYKGVSWEEGRKKWVASIVKDGKRYPLGRYKDEIEAARVYDKKAKELNGEFAWLNFTDGSAT